MNEIEDYYAKLDAYIYKEIKQEVFGAITPLYDDEYYLFLDHKRILYNYVFGNIVSLILIPIKWQLEEYFERKD